MGSIRALASALTALLLGPALTAAGSSGSQSWAAAAVSWSAVTDVSPAGSAASPSLAVSTDGTMATVIWSNFGGTTYVVQAASATIEGNTAKWGTPSSLSGPSTDNPYPKLSLSADGARATAVWQLTAPGGSGSIAQSASATISGNTASWGAAQLLADPGVDGMAWPEVVLSADGAHATAAWTTNGPVEGNYVVESASATITGTSAAWGAMTTLPIIDPNTWNLGPSLALSADGSRTTAVWTNMDPDLGGYVVQSASATIAADKATWGEARSLSSSSQVASSPGVRISADGTRATALWSSNDGTGNVIQSASATISGSNAAWGAAMTLSSSDLTSSDLPELQPWTDLGLSADGTRATAVWDRLVDSANTVESASASISGKAAEWGTPKTLTRSGESGTEPRVGLSADGRRATTIWHAMASSPGLVQATSATITGTAAGWGAVTDLSAPDGYSWWDELGVSADGSRATAVWQRDVAPDDSSASVVKSASAITGDTGTVPVSGPVGPAAGITGYKLGKLSAPPQVLDGGQIRLTATLQAKYSNGQYLAAPDGIAIQVQHRARGGHTWRRILTTRTTIAGAATVDVAERGDGKYRLRVSGEKPTDGVYVDTLRPRIRMRASTRSATAGAPQVTLEIRVTGRTDRSKRVPAPAGSVVLVKYRGAGAKGWQTITTVQLDAQGRATAQVTPAGTGSWRIGLPHARATSRAIRIRVAT